MVFRDGYFRVYRLSCWHLMLLWLGTAGCISQNDRLAFEAARNSDALNQINLINKGNVSNLVLYDTLDTDALLEKISMDAKVKSIAFQLTDVSGPALEAFLGRSNVESLELYGGKFELTDSVWNALLKNTSIKKLALKNVRVHQDSLRAIIERKQLVEFEYFDDRVNSNQKINFERLLQGASSIRHGSVAVWWLNEPLVIGEIRKSQNY